MNSKWKTKTVKVMWNNICKYNNLNLNIKFDWFMFKKNKFLFYYILLHIEDIILKKAAILFFWVIFVHRYLNKRRPDPILKKIVKFKILKKIVFSVQGVSKNNFIFYNNFLEFYLIVTLSNCITYNKKLYYNDKSLPKQ